MTKQEAMRLARQTEVSSALCAGGSMKPIHSEPQALWQKHGLQQFPSVPCQFKIGDRVIFTNDNGVKFVQTVVGFSADDSLPGRYVHTITDTWEGSAGWFPHKLEQLAPIE